MALKSLRKERVSELKLKIEARQVYDVHALAYVLVGGYGGAGKAELTAALPVHDHEFEKIFSTSPHLLQLLEVQRPHPVDVYRHAGVARPVVNELVAFLGLGHLRVTKVHA